MKEILKSLYRLIIRIQLRKKYIYLSTQVRFNSKTVWGGYNKVHERSVVSGAALGRYSYIGTDCYLANAEIGRFCSIGNNVKVIDVTHPTSGFISTHPAFFSTNMQCGTTFVSHNFFNERLSINGRSCIIGNDVWIGDDVRIIGSRKIGDGAIIALGSVVTKDVPPYAIVGGVPAKVIRYRFEDNKIKELLNLQWWNKDEKWIKENLIKGQV